MAGDRRRVRVGLVGYGYAGRTFHAPLIAATPGLELAAVASSDPPRVLADWPGMGVERDAAALFRRDDIDLVVIATPSDTHATLAGAALEAGRHVVVDKPFTTSLADARGLARLAARRKQLLSVFQNRRWDADFLAVREAIAAGAIGEPVHFESHFDRYRPQVRDRWREDAGPGGGIWMDLGPHLVDQALLLLGLPDRVSATFSVQRAGGRGVDWAHVVLECGSRRAILHAGMLVAGGSARFTVHGTRGSLVKYGLDPQEAQLLAGLRPGDPGWGVDEAPMVAWAGDGAAARPLPLPPGDQGRFYEAISTALAGASPNPVPMAQAIAVMAVLEAAVRSAAHGRAVVPALHARERRAWHAAAGATPASATMRAPAA